MRCLMLLLVCCALPVQARDAFTLAGVTVAAGSQASFLVDAAGTQVPVTVVHGANDGVVLTLTAGVHGDEFPSILALQRLRQQLDPAQVSGTVILVHLANLAGFHGRRIALNPRDDKNLNREFPGDPAGTATEQLAHFFTTEIIALTDYLIDLHSGSAYQTLLPHAYSPVLHDEALDARTLAFARATGLEHIVLYDERPNDPANSISYPNTAQTRGKPALTLEIGHLGQRDEESITRVIEACRRALLHLGLIPGAPPPAANARHYSRLAYAESPVTGLFHPESHVGAQVQQGQRLGMITDYFGEPLAEILAPATGTLLMLLETPAVTAGETPVTVGVPVTTMPSTGEPSR
jgi:predicted deacylase